MNATEEIFVNIQSGPGNRFVLSYYVFANFVGAWLCLLLVIAVARKLRKGTAADVFLLGLCLGCIFMSVTCGIQCLANLINGGQFYGGDVACQLEATFHISSILVHYFAVVHMSKWPGLTRCCIRHSILDHCFGDQWHVVDGQIFHLELDGQAVLLLSIWVAGHCVLAHIGSECGAHCHHLHLCFHLSGVLCHSPTSATNGARTGGPR